MMLNDRLGCCTIAGCGHACQVWSLNTGLEVSVPDALISDYYSKWDGWNPNVPGSDQGGNELDVLTSWKNEGFGSNPLTGFVACNPKHIINIKHCIDLFGLAYIGVALPLTAQGQTVWDVSSMSGDGEPGSWGGHCVVCPSYDEQGVTCITWGGLQKMSWSFWDTYVDEAYGLLSPEFLVQGKSPVGFELTQLLSDMEAIS